MAFVQGLSQFSGIAHIFVHHPAAQLARVDPGIGWPQQTEFFSTIEIVDRHADRFCLRSEQLRQQLVGQSVLKPAEAGHESIGPFGLIDIAAQGRRSGRIEGTSEEPLICRTQVAHLK